MSSSRIRTRDPKGGPDIVADLDHGPSHGLSRSVVGATMSAPVSNVGNMNPIVKGRMLNLDHMTGGRAASKAFSLSTLPKKGDSP